MAFSLLFFDFTKRSLLFPSDVSEEAKRYATCPDNDLLDFGTNDFAIEIAGYWDSTIGNQATPKYVLTKNLIWGLANVAGWQIILHPNTSSLSIHLNDGSATEVSSSWAGVWTSNTNTFFRIEFDRDVGINLYKNGILISTKTEITARQGSVNNASALVLGGYPGGGANYIMGAIDLLRLDVGYFRPMDQTGVIWDYAGYPVDYGEVWNYENYLKVRHFWPEGIEHYRAAWYFNNSLVDASTFSYTFSFMDGNQATATPTYGDSYYSPSYTNTFDPLMGSHEWGPVDFNDRKRSLDGTLKIYKGANKLYKRFNFRTTDVEIIIGLLGAWYCNSSLAIYENSTTKPFTMRGYMVEPPSIKEIIHRGADTLAGLYRVWDISISLEEM